MLPDPKVVRRPHASGILRGICLLALLVAPWSWSQTAEAPPADPPAPVPVEQPLPYSHKTHVALGLQCRDCHQIADPGFAAGYPAETTCMACHTTIKTDSPHIQLLAKLNSAGEPVPWNRVYRVPDFVWFSHASHVEDASIDCESCHGPVAQRDALFQEKPTTMSACMDCPARNSAPNDCDLCHDPG